MANLDLQLSRIFILCINFPDIWLYLICTLSLVCYSIFEQPVKSCRIAKNISILPTLEQRHTCMMSIKPDIHTGNASLAVLQWPFGGNSSLGLVYLQWRAQHLAYRILEKEKKMNPSTSKLCFKVTSNGNLHRNVVESKLQYLSFKCSGVKVTGFPKNEYSRKVHILEKRTWVQFSS